MWNQKTSTILKKKLQNLYDWNLRKDEDVDEYFDEYK
jgi:hypothetical protein